MEKVNAHSILLSRTLDSMELSDDHIRAKISKFSRLEVLANAVDFQPDHQNTILTGSTIDGVCWKGYMTDIDTMLRFSYITVTEKDQDAKVTEHYIFEIVDENTHPGYTKLKLIKEGSSNECNIFSLSPRGTRGYCYEEEGNLYLSSYKFKSAFNRYQVIPERTAWVMQSSYNYAVTFPDDEEILEHGPSLCFADETKEEPLHDSVPCFHCQKWPSQASEWITRSPRYWPPQSVVDRISAEGCEVVPVGFIRSESRHLEWRLSFALVERQLLCSFNNTQHKCYSLLKMILKDVVDAEMPNVLSSFQMKNALLWTIEKSDPSLWCEDRLIEAFMACLETMHGFIKNGTAPGYFIPKNNVLDGKIKTNEKERLIELFDRFLKQGWKCLLNCKSLTTDPDLQKLLQKYEESSLDSVLTGIRVTDTKSIWFQHDLQLFPRYEGARLEIMTLVAPQPDDLSTAIIRHHTMLQQLEDRSVNEFYRIVLRPIVAAVQSSLGSHLYSLYVENNGSSVVLTDELLQTAENYLKLGMNSDAAAGKLKYATYLYMTGNVQKCQQMATTVLKNDHLLSSHVPHFLPSKFGPTAKEVNDYETFIRQSDSSLESRFLSSLCQAVLFLPTEIRLAPPAVKFQLQTPLPDALKYTSWLGWGIYDPIIFAYYLTFLCEVKAGRLSDAESALKSIEQMILDKNVGYEVSALNILGYSYVSMNQVERGVPFLLQAMEKSISPNSAVWQMGQTMSNILNGPFARSKM